MANDTDHGSDQTQTVWTSVTHEAHVLRKSNALARNTFASDHQRVKGYRFKSSHPEANNAALGQFLSPSVTGPAASPEPFPTQTQHPSATRPLLTEHYRAVKRSTAQLSRGSPRPRAVPRVEPILRNQAQD